MINKINNTIQNSIGPSIGIGREILCLPYAGFYILFDMPINLMILQIYLNDINVIYILHIIKSISFSFLMCPSLLSLNLKLLFQQEQHLK